MNRYIALLRGINVGGHKKILMADLRSLLESLGFLDVKTYIQSGNVVFSSSDTEGLDLKISEAIKEKYHFEVPVLVLSKTEFEELLNNNPFSGEKMNKCYVTIFHTQPSTVLIAALDLSPFPNDECYVTPQCVYSFYTLGAGKAKCHNNFFESKLKVAATTRNHRTMTALTKLINSFD